MSVLRLAFAAGVSSLLFSAAADAQQQIRCASRNYQYQFCATGEGVTRAYLVSQSSQSPCIEGRSWGWDRRGVWVTQGCDATFRVDSFRPPPPPPSGGGQRVTCASRDDRYEFCQVPGVTRAELVRQNSQTPCVLGRNWGWRGDGIWVNNGCRGEFLVQTGWRPLPPPGPGLVHCESHEYRYSFCSTGPIRNAQLVQQTSRAPCIRGQTWGTQRNGIWVDQGCEGQFRVN